MLSKFTFFVLIFSFCLNLISDETINKNINKNHILFLARSGDIARAIDSYNELKNENNKHDCNLLQEMGMLLLDQGYKSNDPETRLLTIFGAGISLNEKTIYILEDGVNSNIPELQLISLNFLSRYQNDVADLSLQKAMIAAHPLIRLECAFMLAQKKTPRAHSYAESLMYRFDDPSVMPLFPQFFAMIGTNESIKTLKKLMSHPEENVRIASIISATKFQRDDLLPKIRMLATHGEKAQQEACAAAFGALKDDKSIQRLQIFKESQISSIRLAALKSLYILGKKENKSAIVEAANAGDLFAINLLKDINGEENTLANLQNSSNLQIRINACYALLKKQDIRSVQALTDILVNDSRGLIFSTISSKGKSLEAIKVIPNGIQNYKDDPVAFEISLKIREEVLEDVFNLPEDIFLQVAKLIFIKQQNDLVPLTVSLLEELNTQKAIELLKNHYQQSGAPLVRCYCNLALYNLKEKGPFAENIRSWIANKQKLELIRFRPLLPRELKQSEDGYELTPQDNSSLLIASFESLLANKDENAIDILLDAIRNGNAKNKYALAGLLMRTLH